MTTSYTGPGSLSVGALLVLLLTVLAAGIGAIAPATALPQSPEGEIQMSLVKLSPAVLTPADTLTVTARLTNGTDTVLSAAEADLASTTRRMLTRSSLDSWAHQGPDGPVGTVVATQPLPPVEPGGSIDVTFTATPSDLRLSTSPSSWGPRGLAVFVRSEGAIVGAMRTFTAWAPAAETTESVGLTIVAAVTGPPPAVDPLTRAANLAEQTAPDGRLGRLLTASESDPRVGWVIDPAVIRTAQANPATASWAERLLAAQAGRDIAALPAYDVDLAAFAHHPDVDVPADPAASPGDPTAGWRRDLAWPADATPDLLTVGLSAARGATSVIVGAGLDVPEDELDYTPSGVAEIALPTAVVTGLVADSVLSTALAGTGNASQDTQRLLAETAVIAREQPNRVRELLAVLDRSWSPDPAGFTSSMTALQTAPWVHFSGLDTLRSAPVQEVARTPLPESKINPDEISGTSLRALQTSRNHLVDFSVIAADPARLSTPLEPGLIVPASIAYRSDTQSRRDAVTSAVEAVSAITDDSLTLVPRKPVGMGGENVNFPVLIHNSLDQSVTVQIVLHADGNWLRQESIPTVNIPAGEEKSLMIPVRAVASGTVIVEVHAQSVSATPGGGKDVAIPIDTTVILHPELDTVGTWVVVVAVTLLLVGGIVRTVRRGRSPNRAAGAMADERLTEPEQLT